MRDDIQERVPVLSPSYVWPNGRLSNNKKDVTGIHHDRVYGI